MSVVRNAIIGLSVGEAMGVSVRGKLREELLNNPVTNMIPSNVPKGSWSFGTTSSLCVMESIIKCGEISLNDIMHEFLESLEKGKYTALGEVFDIDITSKSSIKKYSETLNINSGSSDIKNSNGCLARMLPIALHAHSYKLRDNQIYDNVKSVCNLTHLDDVCVLGCFIYVKYLIFLLNGKDKYASYNMIKFLDYLEFFDEDIIEYYSRLLKGNIINVRPLDLKSDDYIVHTLETAFWMILNCSSFAESIVGAINLGGSSDVIGALVGSIAGCIFDNIPIKWLDSLIKKEYLESEATRFENAIK